MPDAANPAASAARDGAGRGAWGAWCWPALCGGLGLFALSTAVWALLAPPPWPAWVQAALQPDGPWAWHASQWASQPWQLFGSHLVHGSASHAALNALVMVAMALTGLATGAGAREALALVLAAPLSTMALVAWPDLQLYFGLSGLIHACVGVLFVFCALRVNASHQPHAVVAVVLGGGLLIKLTAEQAWRAPLVQMPEWPFAVAVAGHVSGALVGIGLEMLLVALGLFPPGRGRQTPD